MEEPGHSDSEISIQRDSEFTNDNGQGDDNQRLIIERNRALSSVARKLSAVATKRDDPSMRQLAADMRAGKLDADPHPPSIALGKPPPHIHSQTPPISVQPQHTFGKLVVGIIKGHNLKAGQGVFGRADPYVKLKIGDKEFTTSCHKDGGKNPVSFVLNWYDCCNSSFLSVKWDIVHCRNRNGRMSLSSRLLRRKSLKLRLWTRR